ncbi:hypothetical protein [Rhizobium sp. BK661]
MESDLSAVVKVPVNQNQSDTLASILEHWAVFIPATPRCSRS